ILAEVRGQRPVPLRNVELQGLADEPARPFGGAPHPEPAAWSRCPTIKAASSPDPRAASRYSRESTKPSRYRPATYWRAQRAYRTGNSFVRSPRLRHSVSARPEAASSSGDEYPLTGWSGTSFIA